MPHLVELSVRAERDLVRVFESIDGANSEPARRWYRGLFTAIGSLSEMPERCPVTPESDRHRHLLYGNYPDVYRIIFKIDNRQHKVVINHIRHGARSEFTR